MAKRTFAIVAVFAAMLSVTLSVQAEDYDYFWTGNTNSNYQNKGNWALNDGSPAPVALDGHTGDRITANIKSSNGEIKLDYSTLCDQVFTVNLGLTGGVATATLYREGGLTIDSGRNLNVLDGGSFLFRNSGALTNNGTINVSGGSFVYSSSGAFSNSGNINVSSGTFNYSSSNTLTNSGIITVKDDGNFNSSGSGQFRISGSTAGLNINGGNASFNGISYIGVSDNGFINQSGGTATFNNILVLGWGDGDGTYTLSGGTLVTTADAGLWCAKSSGYNVFNVNGGTANFNQTGNSFTVGYYNGTFTPTTVANVFTLSSGTVNAADTFAVQYGGKLVINGGEFNAPTITVDSTSTINMTDGALKTNAINMNGGTFTQGGGSLVYNGKLSVSGSAVLNGSIDMSKFLAKPNQTVTAVTTTNGVSGNYSINGAGWTSSIVDNSSIVATYAGDTNISYWNAVSNVYDAGSNWIEYKDGEWTQVSTRYIFGDSGTSYSDRDCYILPFYDSTDSTVQNVTVTFNNTYLRVNSITVGNGVGDDSTGTATVTRSGSLDVQTNLTINKGGAFSVSDALSVTAFNGTSGTLTVDGGTFSTNTTSVSGNLNVLDGTFTSTGAATINAGGKVSISGGDFNANSSTTVSGNLTINDGNFNAKGTTTVNSGGKLTVNGGTFEFNNSDAQFLVKGDINVLSGNFTITSSNAFRIGDYAKGTVNIEGGTVTVKAPTYMGIGANSDYVGTINQKTGSTVTFENVLYLGWGNNVSGVYNLYGGTLNTNDEVGLWNGNENGKSTFNVEGGTANFNNSGESFTVGLGGTNSLANEFYLYSGTVNAKETFAVKYGGTLYVKEKDQNAGDGVLNAKGITLSNNGNLNMSSGTINLGSGGITNSGDYNITLSGGTFGTNYANWSSALTAEIESGTVTFDPDAGRTISWSGVLSGDGGITKTGAGSLTIVAGASGNTYTGGTTVSAGTLYLQGTNQGKSSVGTGDVTINSGAAIVAQSHNVFGSGDASNIPEKVIINGGSLTPNEYLHMKSLEINSGTVNSNGSTGDGLDFYDRNGTITSTGASSIASAITNSSTLTINVTNGELTLSGSSINNKTETSKTIIQQGTVKLTGTFTSGKRFIGTITIAETATLDCAYHDSLGYDSDTTKINIYGLMDNSVQNETLNNTELHMYGGTAQSSSGGTFDILNSGVKFYSYPKDELQTTTTVSTISSDLRLRHGNTLAIDTAANSHLKLTGEITGLYSGTENTCSITKLGAGTLTLSGANTYKGETIVNVGVLELTGDAVVANGPVTVDSTGTLVYEVGKDIGGQPITKKLSISETNKIYSTGTVKKTGDGILQLYSAAQGLIDVESLVVSSGRVDLKGYMTGGITVDANAVFSPGNSVGEATFGGDYILYEGAKLLIEMDNTGIDKLTASSFDLSDGLIQFENNGIPGGSRYDILHATGNTVFSLDDDYLQDLKNSLPEFMTLSVEDNGKTVRLLIDRNQVPEPSTWALLALGAAGMLYWRKRKNNK